YRGVVMLRAQLAREVAGVNENCARGLAHTINCACVNAVVLILLVQRPGEFEVAQILSSLNLAAKDNPFTRRKSDISRWTDVFAVPALHATVHFLFHRRGHL